MFALGRATRLALGARHHQRAAVSMALAVDESLSCRCGGDHAEDGRVADCTKGKEFVTRPVRQARRRRSDGKSTNCRRDSGIMLAYCCRAYSKLLFFLNIAV